MLEFLVVDNKGKFYITILDKDNYEERMSNLLINGHPPEKTYKEDWYKINNFPEYVMKRTPDKTVQTFWELKPAYATNTSFPQTVYSEEDFAEELLDACYDIKRVVIPGEYVGVEFTVKETIFVDGEFNVQKARGNYQHHLIDQIQTHSDLLYLKKCFISQEESFKRITKYFKENLDFKQCDALFYEASLSIVVRKKLYYYLPVEFRVTRKKGRKYKTELQIKDHEVREVFRLEKGNLFSFTGENEEDLEKNIKNYCKEIVDFLNTPAEVCTSCDGVGYRLKKITPEGKQEDIVRNHDVFYH